jgi:hypothetical protein
MKCLSGALGQGGGQQDNLRTNLRLFSLVTIQLPGQNGFEEEFKSSVEYPIQLFFNFDYS